MGANMEKIFLVILISSLPSFVFGNEEEKKEFTWYNESGHPHNIYLDPNYLSLIHNEREIHVDADRKSRLFDLSEQKVTMVNESPQVTIFKVNTRKFRNGAIKNSSPVFSFSKDTGPELVLMGGVSLTFKNEISEGEIEGFLRRENLHVLQVVKYIKRTVYRIETAPGLSALHLANELRKKKIVKSAVPNFGRSLYLR